jgi:hypothetical protein
MSFGRQRRRFTDHTPVQWALFGFGMILLVVSPLVGAIPGPGGILIAGIGLALVLRTSMWAKRRYVRFKRWQPRAGHLSDLALGRRAVRRRQALRKAVQSGSAD